MSIKKEWIITNEYGKKAIGYFNSDRIVLNKTTTIQSYKGNGLYDKREEVTNIQFNLTEIKELYKSLGELIELSETIEEYRKTTFSIECDIFIQEGYTKENRWNGWECPYFELPEALDIVKEMNDNAFGSHDKSYYNEVEDAFYLYDEGVEHMEDESKNGWDIVKGEYIRVGGKQIKVYPIGNGAWIWSEHVTQEEIDNPEEPYEKEIKGGKLIFNNTQIDNIFLSECLRFPVNPKEYYHLTDDEIELLK